MSTAAPAPANAVDLLDVLGLVRSVGLPTEGISEAFPLGYAVVRDGAKLLGVAVTRSARITTTAASATCLTIAL